MATSYVLNVNIIQTVELTYQPTNLKLNKHQLSSAKYTVLMTVLLFFYDTLMISILTPVRTLTLTVLFLLHQILLSAQVQGQGYAEEIHRWTSEKVKPFFS